MIRIDNKSQYLINGTTFITDDEAAAGRIKKMTGMDVDRYSAQQGTMAYSILSAHNRGEDEEKLNIVFDSLTSHDLTFVGIIQTAKASGLKAFPMPYVLTNCHNSLCAVGGTINSDDQKYGLSAAKKYGGIYVPANISIIHSYNREMMTKCGNMILGSDSHTRYGALGTMGFGEGGGELVKQLLNRTYDIKMPEVVAVHMTGKPSAGVGPHDIALQLIGKTFESGVAKNKILEFIGEGIHNLDVEFRNSIDVMTTETSCLSSIWITDDKVKKYYRAHHRAHDFSRIAPKEIAYYSNVIHVNLDEIKPSIALPFHPSNVYTIEEVNADPYKYFKAIEDECKKLYSDTDVEIKIMDKIVDGKIMVDQGIIGGCSGGVYDNIVAAADILECHPIENKNFMLSIYPGSQPTNYELTRTGDISKIMQSGGVIRTSFCGPCFGAGDTPANNEFSIRHNTRNFPNREGSIPADQQIAYVALMDAKSIAATAANGGILTAATDFEIEYSQREYVYNESIYKNKVVDCTGNPDPNTELLYGPNIKDWPQMPALKENLLLKIVSYIEDSVTTTDELIPSGETASFRSDPYKIADYTLFRRDPDYVPKAKALKDTEVPDDVMNSIKTLYDVEADNISYGSTIYAKKPGDGSAREHAASCQKVLGAWANLAHEYATKRYWSNLINWGMIPFIIQDEKQIQLDDHIFIPNILEVIDNSEEDVTAYVLPSKKEIKLKIGYLDSVQKSTLKRGCLINYYNQTL
ncbi:hydratase [Fusibacter ferrireducens]|uniref:Hydratase n=1 Tax=Fusibacter ferrireducens TaxID=2785058 RepID=A0ABR9ZNS3_9FIRM|nr:hydratase [Fusibacter ferrireducens]MBF4692110.1 hydratase [Fusibacter ferrireducens]